MQRRHLQSIGLFAGPLASAVTFLLLRAGTGGDWPPLSIPGCATLAVMVWMAVWWLTEAVEIAVTALLPIVLFPLLGVATIQDATAPYGSDLVFLFGGGFILALSMQRWGLDRRIALITLNIVGTTPRRMVAGFMIVTAVLSAFVSNTATVAMMLPIALSVIDLVRRQHQSEGDGNNNFALSLLLGTAYAASIGGIATVIGTPPNGLLIKFIATEINEPYRKSISFAQWMLVGIPLAVVFLPLTWWMLTAWIYPVGRDPIRGGRALLREQKAQLGSPNRGEWITFIVFMLTACAWIVRQPLNAIEVTIGGESIRPLGGLTDAGIAVTAAVVLFAIPVKFRERTFAMNWETARGMPWGTLILFGGGLSLAAAVRVNGVAEFFGGLAASLGGTPTLLVIIVITTSVILLTELTSNTATTATLLPVLAGAAVGMDVHPYLLIIPAAVAASCAFMMPVATPPNAIVFGSGHLTIPQMCKAGLWLNLVGVILVTLLTYTIVLRVFEIQAGP